MKKLFLLSLSIIQYAISHCQSVGIGTATPNQSAQLDIVGTDKGLLIPRLTSTQRIGIEAPVNSLMVFDVTTCSYWFYKGNRWNEIATGSTTSDSSLVYGKKGGTISSFNMTNGADYTDSSGYLYDSGGPNNNYSDNEDYTITISPIVETVSLRIQVLSNNLENPYDSLFIKSYTDGNAFLIDTLTGTETITRYCAGGVPVQIRFKTNAVNTAPGFKIRWDNIYLPPPAFSNVIVPLTGWYYDPLRIAMHGGVNLNNNWSKDSSGLYSFNYGYGNKAKGDYSAAIGRGNAIGDYSIAGGTSTASGDFAVALGGVNKASGISSTAMGSNSLASGEVSTAMGSYSTASGLASTALGWATTASGNYTTAMGIGTAAKSSQEAVIGSYNTDYTPLSTTDWNAADRLFVIGNGASSFAKNDAVVVLKNGNTGIGISTPEAAKLTVAGNTSDPQLRLYQADGGYSRLRLSNANEKMTGRYWDIAGITDAADASSDKLAFFNSGLGDILSIKGNGNVGIGTNIPNAPLQFGNVGGNRKIVLWEGANNDHEFMGFGINNSVLRYQTSNSTTDHVFYSAIDASSSKELVRIKGNGNTGIGISNPTSKLDISGALATPIIFAPAGPLTLDNSAAVWDVTASTPITLPTPSSCPNRRYLLVNRGGGVITINAPGYIDFNNNFSYQVPINSSIEIIASGNAWWHIK